MKQLRSFPVALVKKTSAAYNKSFHAKVFTLFASSESMMHRFAARMQPSYTFCYAFLKDDQGQWFMDNGELLKVRTWVLHGARRGIQHVMKVYQRWQKDWEAYLKISNRFLDLNLAKLSDQTLYQEFSQFHDHYLNAGSMAYLTDSFMSTGTEDWLEEMMHKELKRLGIAGDRAQLVRLLTSPVHLSFALEEELEFWNIAAQFSKHYSIALPTYAQVKVRTPALYQALKHHEARFFWIRNNYYHVEYLDASKIYQRIRKTIFEARRKKQNLYKLANARSRELQAFRAQREKILSRTPLSTYHRNVLEIAKLFAKWKDLRKSGVYMGMHHYDQFLGEIARRRGMSKHDLTFTVFQEVSDVLFKHRDFFHKVAQRKERTFFAVTDKGYFIVGGAKAVPYFKYFRRGQSTTEVKELRGVAASPGRAIGLVRVIRRTEEMLAFKVGEILVANQTTPDFVPIMRRAAAIVTEQGGVTSHAAVVSRELHIPCVIGTKIATEVLKDGDLVEVNANHGVVTVIKRG